MYFVVQSISMNEQERAEEHLRTIRRLMERATIYRAISAPTALVGGLLSLAASAVYLEWGRPKDLANDDVFLDVFLWLWLLVLLLTAATNTLFIVLGARRRDEPVFSASMKAALTALAPPFLAAATLTLCFAGTSWIGGLFDFVISFYWALFYGLGLLATSHFAPRSLILLGWAFFLSGMLGLVSLRFNPDEAIFNPTYFMAATFGLFHLIYAACAWPRKGAPPEL